MDEIEQDDIEALLSKPPIARAAANSLAKLNPENIESTVLDEASDIMQKSNDALSEILLAVQSSPDDNTLLSGAASFLKAHTALLAEINKINLQKDKLRHQEDLQKMKSGTNLAVAKMENETRVMLTREELARQAKKSKAVDAEVIEDAETNQITEGDTSSDNGGEEG